MYNWTPRSPSRLLKIELPRVKLVFTSDLPERVDYCTLSHCWGLKLSLQLTSETFDRLSDGILTSSLPNTFRDAVTVCQKLSFDHLWIDALCNQQDSVEDWAQECSRMGGRVCWCKSQYLASASSNSDEGLFRTRVPELLQPFDYLCEGEGEEFSISIVTDKWKPITYRGWIMQERILAPRLLHFGPNQILWECRQCVAMEIHPDGIHNSVQAQNPISH